MGRIALSNVEYFGSVFMISILMINNNKTGWIRIGIVIEVIDVF